MPEGKTYFVRGSCEFCEICGIVRLAGTCSRQTYGVFLDRILAWKRLVQDRTEIQEVIFYEDKLLILLLIPKHAPENVSEDTA